MMKRFFLFVFFTASLLPFVNAQTHYDLYGLAQGGAKGMGVIYRYDLLANTFDTLMSFDGLNGAAPAIGGKLILASDGQLYGLTAVGGKYNDGVMFRFNPITFKDTVLINFDSIVNGSCYDHSGGGLGAYIMQTKSGLIYGTTAFGGSKDSGVFFNYNIDTGKDSVLFSFNNSIGAIPIQAVTEDTLSGILYGTTVTGGTKDLGVIYSYNPTTKRDSVIFNFDSIGENGAYPIGINFCPASDGLFYGMTSYGGAFGNGTLYSFNPATGKDSTLIHNYDSYYNGGVPWRMSLMEASNGLLYGFDEAGGFNADGFLYSYDRLTNTIAMVHNFTGSDGSFPLAGVTQDSDNGLLYGITETGGQNNTGVLFSYDITNNIYTVLHNFDVFPGAGSNPLVCPTLVRVSDSTSSVKEIQPQMDEVNVYPNPSNGQTIVNLIGNNYREIYIYDVLGRAVYTQKINSGQHSVPLHLNLNNGIYILKITTTNACISKRLIIER